MNSGILSSANKINRLGFHYYDDTDHYDAASLDFWLPKLQAAGTRWIVLTIPERAEIPENFLVRLVKAGIEPIINLQLSLSNPPERELFTERTAYYRNAGVHLIHFFGKPNMKSSWSAADWQKSGLVERFLATFATLAEICINNKIIPIFPMLEPGGDYWDTSFLKESLILLRDRYAQTLLPNLIFSANAGFQEHPLNWGKGGPEANPGAKAYSQNAADHRGFYIYEWYQSLIKQTLKHTFPIVLLQAGQWSSGTGPFDTTPKESRQQFFKVLAMLQQNTNTQQPEEKLPAYVISCNLYKLPTEYVMSGKVERAGAENRKSVFAKFVPNFMLMDQPEGKSVRTAKTVGEEAGSLLLKLLTKVLAFFTKESRLTVPGWFETLVNQLRSLAALILHGQRISDYFLIPDMMDGLSEEQQRIIQQFMKSTNCKSGRNLNEALASPKVILINDKSLYPQNIIRILHNNNCQIRTVSVSKRGN